MWLWLRKRLPKSLALWSKLVAYVGGLHCIVLFMLFFVYQGDNHYLSFVINRHIDINAAVVFLPLQKRAGALNGAQSATTAKQTEQPKIQEPAKEVASVAPAKKNNEKAATTIAAAKQSKKKANKKNKKIVAQKKTQATPEKPVELKKDEPQKELAVQPKPAETLSVASTSTAVAQGGENIQYLGRLDLQALEIQDAINSEVGQHWSPPPGIAKSAICEMNVIVGWDGAVNFSIKKPSGIAIFDVSARTAMRNASFPKQIWGKEFLIAFKQ